ncbi:SAM-dependent methyltransferase [Nonomuraea sp. NPDC026600]|uniref:SAM-dependent methyltransferase n=1 Tax=Nonomuraea sp. NPDC026600 TaxID=3155363 RepID=UPI0033D6FBFE
MIADSTPSSASAAPGSEGASSEARSGEPSPPPRFDPAMPGVAGVYNAFQGTEKDSLPAERAVAAELDELIGGGLDEARRENRAALARMVSHVARHRPKIRQWMDIGAGMPVPEGEKISNLSALVREIQPDRLWLNVDIAARPLVHGRALLDGDGVTTLKGDLRQLEQLLAEAERHLNLRKPVVVILGAVLHFLNDDEAARVIAVFRSRLAAGSVVIVTHATGDSFPPGVVEKVTSHYERRTRVQPYLRSGEQLAALLADCKPFKWHEPGSGPQELPLKKVPLTFEMLPDESSALADPSAPHARAAIAVLRGS